MNHNKRRKEIEAMAKRAGVDILEYTHTGAGHIGILVEASNGAKKRFSCSRNSGDHRADKNQESYLRQFGSANIGASTPAQQAEAAAEATITPAPATTTSEDTMTTTSATSKPAAAKKIQKHQTSHVEFFRLCEWMKVSNLAGVYTIPRCMELAAAALNFPVPYTAIQSALEATGVKLPERPAGEPLPKRDRTYVLAKELATLLRELGKEPSEDLLAIVNRTGAV